MAFRAKNKCPNCGSEEFVTEPNQYDMLYFENGEFRISHTEFVDVYAIRCRGCGGDIDEEKSIERKRVVLKKLKR